MQKEFVKLEEDMFRAYFIILIFHLGFIFQGCAALECLDGSQKEEVEALKMSKEQISNEAERLKGENANLQRQIDALQEENQRIRNGHGNKIAKLRDENKLLNEQISTLKEEKQRIVDKNQVFTEKLTRFPFQYELEKDIRKFKIKVLSGDGDLNSAEKFAKKLRNMGYTIKLIDKSPRSNFSQNTVFFAPKFQNEAEQLASRLGGTTIFKPLSWPSIFDLIVVTGKSH